MSEQRSEFGKPGVTPADLVAFLRPRLASMLERVPEEQQEELLDWLRVGLEAEIKPAEAGELILAGEFAEEALETMWQEALAQARRDLGR